MFSEFQGDIIYKYNQNKTQTLELEVRLGSNPKTEETLISEHSFLRLLNKLQKKRFLSETEHSTDYLYENDIRKRVTEESTIWQRKKALYIQKKTEYGAKLTLSEETNLVDMTERKAKTLRLFRIRDRISFFYGTYGMRIDLTRVNSVLVTEALRSQLREGKEEELVNEASRGETRYEVEIEYQGKDLTLLSEFFEGIDIIWKWLYGTANLYTYGEKIDMVDRINGLFDSKIRGNVDKNIIVEARNLKLRDLVWGGLIGNKETNYTATIKVDGQRKLFIIDKIGIWFVYPPHEYNLVFRPQERFESIANTILDGELVPKRNRQMSTKEEVRNAKYFYVPFDCLMFAGNRDVQYLQLDKRHNFVDELAKGFRTKYIYLYTKNFYTINTVDDFRRVNATILEKSTTRDFLDDGIIFTPINEVYNPHNEYLPMNKRVLSRVSDVCKWKPTDQLTIDFAIVWKMDENGKEIPVLHVSDKGELVPFEGTAWLPFRKDQVVQEHELTNSLRTGAIVEYKWDRSLKVFVPIRLRTEKPMPNRLEIAIDNWELIHSPISEKVMLGQTITLMRRYHNATKNLLYSMVPKGSTLLDIGGGRGGDVAKWMRFSKIVTVEPNEENRRELERRIQQYKMQKKVRVVPTIAEDTEAVTRAVEEFIGRKVDFVSMMFSMTFFWRSRETLDNLANTINANLKNNGTLIFVTLDGDSVRQRFKPVSGIAYKELSFGPVTIKYDYEQEKIPGKGEVLTIEMPSDTIVKRQDEYLVRVTDLSQRLGLEIQKIKQLNSEFFMFPYERELSELYSYGYMSNLKKDDKGIFCVEEEHEVKPQTSEVLHKVDVPWLKREFQAFRITALTEGGCFLNSLLSGFHPTYQEAETDEEKIKIVKLAREQLAEHLGTINTEISTEEAKFTNWEVLGQGSLVELMVCSIRNWLVNLKSPRGSSSSSVIKDLAYVQEEIQTRKCLPRVLFKYVSDALFTNLYILQVSNDKVIGITFGANNGRDRNVILLDTGEHFDLFGVLRDDDVVTSFAEDDPIIRKLKLEYNIKDFEPFDPIVNVRSLFGKYFIGRYNELLQMLEELPETEPLKRYTILLDDLIEEEKELKQKEREERERTKMEREERSQLQFLRHQRKLEMIRKEKEEEEEKKRQFREIVEKGKGRVIE